MSTPAHKTRRSVRAALFTLTALALTACASIPSPADIPYYVEMHTRCTPAGYSDLAWSPDSGTIYNTVYEASLVYITSTRVDTSETRNLIVGGFTPNPSPDGSMLLYQHSRHGAASSVFALLDLQTKTIRDVFQDVDNPLWSPDSQWLLYSISTPASGPISKTNVQTGETIALTDFPEGDSFPDSSAIWSPDGQYITYSSERGSDDDRSSLYVMGADGTGAHKVLDADGPACSSPSAGVGFTPLIWLPDGEHIYYLNYCGGSMAPEITDLSGEQVQSWNSGIPGALIVDWSADSERILALGPASSTGVCCDLYTGSTDGSAMSMIYTNVTEARFSPDSQKIAFLADDAAGLTDLYVMNTDGTGVRRLTDNPGHGAICVH